VPSESCGQTSRPQTRPTLMQSPASFLDEFPDVINTGKTLPAPVHDVVHIKKTGPPIVSRFWRLDGDKLEAARREFKAMEQEGIIWRSTSPWASPLHLVPRRMGCGGCVEISGGSILSWRPMSISCPTGLIYPTDWPAAGSSSKLTSAKDTGHCP
jgi:hypothetical protein